MNNITAVVITKNAEQVIKDCLKSISFADKTLVIDCNSTDKTVEVALKNKAQVVKTEFQDFATLRNLALKYVRTKWTMYADSDERVTDDLKKNILEIIATNVSAISFNRKNYYLGKPWPKSEVITRMFQTDKLKKWQGIIHESPVYTGSSVLANGELLHYTHRTIEEMLDKTITWSTFEAKLRYDNYHLPITWWRLIRVYLTGLFNSYLGEQGIRAGKIGLIESLYQGFSMYITYLKLWELQKNAKK